MENSPLSAFIHLGKLFQDLGNELSYTESSKTCSSIEYENFNELILRQKNSNPWFTEINIRKSLYSLSKFCKNEELMAFVNAYKLSSYSSKKSSNPKTIAIIMAGNIPLVGFHDLLCVLLSGNNALIKLSSDDQLLLPEFLNYLCSKYPFIKEKYSISTSSLKNMDGVIATGNDNSNLYFKKYFGHLPHIFRKNRTSIAVICGSETNAELISLGKDIFSYFGRGCRSVSHLLIHESFEINRFFEAIVHQGEIINHNKYGNNYDYNRAVHLMNQIPILDNNFVLLKETEELFSPLAMIHYHRYSSENEIDSYVESHKESIQAITGMHNNRIPFGAAQSPSIFDFADDIDTMKWLVNLN
ncbi:MAG: acyl-CoA reductase [Crocinitomicaceae bacterium]|nr:acyl-CoA reductase [Crocinitomicaceae bacterium]